MSLGLILKVGVIVLMLIYPILVCFGLSYFDVRWVATFLFAIMLIRGLFLPTQYRYRVWAMVAIGMVVAVCGYVFNDPVYLRLYPALMSFLMLAIFAFSLRSPPSVIELFARLSFKGEAMPQHVVAYTRNVTKVWCVFFVVNGAIAASTVTAPIHVWALYNGFISYLLMGLLFIIEFSYRHFIVKKRHAIHSVVRAHE